MRAGYKILRRTVLSAYILIVVVFCFLMIRLGRIELERSRAYSERQESCLRGIFECRAALDRLDLSLQAFFIANTKENAGRIYVSTEKLRRRVWELAELDRKNKAGFVITIKRLGEELAALCSVSSALLTDIPAPASERPLLINRDLEAATDLAASIKEDIRLLFAGNLLDAESRYGRSYFLFRRLQFTVIFFFVITTFFMGGAYVLLDYFLRREFRKLRRGTREFSRGNLSFRFGEISGDETGSVMRDFNAMAGHLQHQADVLQKANIELREANEHKDNFLANMSHELRTPLNSIIGFAELLIKSSVPGADKKLSSYSHRILNAAEHLLDMISNLLDVVRADAGILKPDFVSFDLRDCIEEALDMIRPLAERKKLEVKVNCKDPMPVSADRRLLRQVFINLLNNAVKFTEEGHMALSAESVENEYRVDIEDTGIGISAEEQKHIFKDFHRVESGLTTTYDGTGIGLTLSKRLIELHQGRIIVKSEIGKGSVFSVFIPFKTENTEGNKK